MPSCDDEGCWRRALRLAEVVDDNGDNNDAASGLRWCDLELMTIAVGTASFGLFHGDGGATATINQRMRLVWILNPPRRFSSSMTSSSVCASSARLHQ
ncbi:hypothetical protein MRB53_016047 [Persea americana]|uniref:Uncharacterized protein n=1 Tax=Persea americana TaxID=3435 RepID=A0ACC2M129_PERAE|nr:hypothetical protein MRB53_016047 [Persea americana]